MSGEICRRLARNVLSGAAVICAACAVGPDYRKPAMPTPASYKEIAPDRGVGQWKPARPGDALRRGKWWEVFDDPQLDAFEEQVALANQNLAAAEARLRAARDVAQGSRAGLFPTVTGIASAQRFRGLQLRTDSRTPNSFRQTIYEVPVDFNYQVDVWGRIRRSVEAAVGNAQASAADLETIRLSLQAELAVDYFQLRGLDAEIRLLTTATDSYARSFDLVIKRREQGASGDLDLAQAQAQLETTRVQLIDLGVARAQFEHAIATLTGKPASSLSVGPSASQLVPPEIPLGLPSEILERRPDIAGAERRMAAANALIGVAKGAYFPVVTLAASGGYESSTLAKLFFWPSRVWSVGATAVETLLDFGRRRAATDEAKAGYEAAVAEYRESVLSAFEEVEDNLAALRILAEEAKQQAVAVEAAERVQTVAQNRYLGGNTAYLEIISAQSAALNNRRTEIEILTRRLTAAVNLVKALGGGWAASDLPTPAAVLAKQSPPPAASRP
jgi:NodT family efflux transporter outer membrane factor (OMF) lipoprotein